MKTKNIFQCLVVVFALFMYSCSSDSDNDTGEPSPGGGGSGITSITVTASSNSIELGGSVTFTVTANDGSNVTTSSTILVNNSTIQGVEYTPTATGSYQITAKNGSLTSGAISVEVTPPVITALRVESTETSIKIGDTADFTVIGTDAGGNEYTITDSATLTVNGNAITGSRFMTLTTDDLVVTADKDGITSDVFNLPVTDETAPGTFQRTVSIIDATGGWCGWCTRVSYGIELVEAATDKAFIVAAHTGDPMQNSFSTALIAQVNPGGSYPTAVLNGTTEWTYPEPSNVAQATNLASGTTSLGLSVNSLLKGNELEVYVSTAFAQSTAGAKLVVMILEDGIVASQANYTSYYGAADPISQFVHNHTLRHSITNVLGDAIPNIAGGTKNEEVFSIPVPSTVNNANEMSILALIVAADGKVLNVNGAHVGVDKDFQAN